MLFTSIWIIGFMGMDLDNCDFSPECVVVSQSGMRYCLLDYMRFCENVIANPDPFADLIAGAVSWWQRFSICVHFAVSIL